MKLAFSRLLVLSLLILATGWVHAEGNCPAGYYPIGAAQGQQGPQGCAPIPNYDQQQVQQHPPTQWISHWGAIATDGPGGSFGSSSDLPTQQVAEDAALANCRTKKGSTTCSIDLSYANGCAAMVVGDASHNSKPGVTIDLATREAMKICNGADKHCFVYYTGCSLPMQIP